jgi:hypothetical protein
LLHSGSELGKASHRATINFHYQITLPDSRIGSSAGGIDFGDE